MPYAIAHFAINADDVDLSRAFYEAVFGWTFHAYGPPGFFMIESPQAPEVPLRGSLQKRRTLIPGVRTTGFECTIPVTDIEATARLVVRHGGAIIMPKVTLAGIGHLFFFTDPGGNTVGAMQYDTQAE
jgi:uncharacterized protein